MATSRAATSDAYLEELPAERRALVAAVRELVRRHLPAGYRETMGFGMICWVVPLERYPDTYNGQPLAYVSLASQKDYCSLHLMGPYGDAAVLRSLEEGFAAAGKRLDMGKSCLRFRSLDALAPDAVGRAIAALTPEAFIARYEASRPPKATAKRRPHEARSTGKRPAGPAPTPRRRGVS